MGSVHGYGSMICGSGYFFGSGYLDRTRIRIPGISLPETGFFGGVESESVKNFACGPCFGIYIVHCTALNYSKNIPDRIRALFSGEIGSIRPDPQLCYGSTIYLYTYRERFRLNGFLSVRFILFLAEILITWILRCREIRLQIGIYVHKTICSKNFFSYMLYSEPPVPVRRNRLWYVSM